MLREEACHWELGANSSIQYSEWHEKATIWWWNGRQTGSCISDGQKMAQLYLFLLLN